LALGCERRFAALDKFDVAAKVGRAGASVLIPKFANLAAPSDANFGIKGTLATL